MLGLRREKSNYSDRLLEDENAKLKKLLAEQMLDAAALRELLSKKW
jgi:putative transposase